MQDIFYEESAVTQNTKKAKSKFNLMRIFSISSYVLAVFWFMLFFYFYSIDKFQLLGLIIQVILPFAFFIFSGVMFGKYKNKMYVDYDYTFVTGSIRISKIINQVKRKKVIYFETSNILQLGKYGSETYEKIAKTPNLKKIILTSNVTPIDGKDFYYLHISTTDAGHKLLIFECTELFMATILRYSNKTILEKDFK